MKKRTESDVVRAILDYLYSKRYFAWRNNTVGVWDDKKKAYRKNPNTAIGAPDIFVLHQGIFIGLECKTDTGKHSDEQKYFGNMMMSRGGKYFVVREVDDVVKIGL